MSPALDDVEILVTVVPEPTVGVRVDPPTVNVVTASNVAPGLNLPPGGTTGQVLAKLSDADGDVGWVDP